MSQYVSGSRVEKERKEVDFPRSRPPLVVTPWLDYLITSREMADKRAAANLGFDLQ
jgi:hypothetical protein